MEDGRPWTHGGVCGRGLASEVTTGTGTGMFQHTPGGGFESEVVSGTSGTEVVYEMDGGLVRAVLRTDGVDSCRESVVVDGETIGILTRAPPLSPANPEFFSDAGKAVSAKIPANLPKFLQ